MTNPVMKTREEVDKDLRVAGFDEKHSRAILQAVVDTIGTLQLVTRSDLEQAVSHLDQKIEVIQQDIEEVKQEAKKDRAEVKQEMAEIRTLIFRGFIICTGILSLVIILSS